FISRRVKPSGRKALTSIRRESFGSSRVLPDSAARRSGSIRNGRLPKICGSPSRRRQRVLQAFCLAEFPYHGRRLLVQSVHSVVHTPHIGGGHFSGKFRQRRAQFRKPLQRGLARDGYGVVRRKIVCIVLQRHQIQRFDQAVGGISGGNVHL